MRAIVFSNVIQWRANGGNAMPFNSLPTASTRFDATQPSPFWAMPHTNSTAQPTMNRTPNYEWKWTDCMLYFTQRPAYLWSSILSIQPLLDTAHNNNNKKYVNVRGGIECFARVLWDAVVARPPRRLWFDIDNSWILMNLWIFFHYEKIILNSFSVFFFCEWNNVNEENSVDSWYISHSWFLTAIFQH